MPGGLTPSTGVLVIYADEESFTPMTPQDHMFAGWIAVSADPAAESPCVDRRRQWRNGGG
jgi:hypothetical protein